MWVAALSSKVHVMYAVRYDHKGTDLRAMKGIAACCSTYMMYGQWPEICLFVVMACVPKYICACMCFQYDSWLSSYVCVCVR